MEVAEAVGRLWEVVIAKWARSPISSRRFKRSNRRRVVVGKVKYTCVLRNAGTLATGLRCGDKAAHTFHKSTSRRMGPAVRGDDNWLTARARPVLAIRTSNLDAGAHRILVVLASTSGTSAGCCSAGLQPRRRPGVMIARRSPALGSGRCDRALR